MSSLLQQRRKLIAELLLRGVLIIVVLAWGAGTFVSDLNYYWYAGKEISWSHLPYRDFLWEYPPLTCLVLLLIPLTGGSQEIFQVVVMVSAVITEYVCLCLLRHTLPEKERNITLFWTLAVLPLCALAYFRLDVFVMAFATVAIVSLLNGRDYKLVAVLGFLMKLWPLVFVGTMLIERRLKSAAIVLAASAISIYAWYLYSPEGVRDFIQYRSGDGFQIESIPGVLLLISGRTVKLMFGAGVVSDHGWEWVHIAMAILLVGIPIFTFQKAWRAKKGSVNLVALTGLWVICSILFQRLLSPQFLIWLAPFVAMLFLIRPRLAYIYGASGWISLIIVQRYPDFANGNIALNALGCLRNALLVWLAIEIYSLISAIPQLAK